ncbi:hypothetical protein Pan1_34 [Pseudanabaena phage Pan1]|nr:hypothetical protein Pan1_34 [Pseudanabaena phage Pan1]
MAYSTGSGDYNALMAAVLAHAVGDGWTTTAGNWPISKGNVRGVDWTTTTISDPDFTALGGANRTNRVIQIGVGTSPANATANAALTGTSSARLPNMDRTFTNWWIFSDPGVGKPDYIHVVFQFSNGINPDCFGHFSFGELDRHGMSHGGIAYAAASPMRGYAASIQNTQDNGNSARDWNAGPYRRVLRHFTGRMSTSFTTAYYLNNLAMIAAAPSVFPASPAGFPAVDTLFSSDVMLDTYSPTSGALSSFSRSTRSSAGVDNDFALSTWFMMCLPQPYSGAIALGPLPVLILNGTTNATNAVHIGSFPNVRLCSMEGYNPGDEVTFGAETWVVFPMLRKTEFAQWGVLGAITSATVGFAYKKVV